jgi:hypothetical protein
MDDFNLDNLCFHKDISKYLSKIGITCKFFADKKIKKKNYTLISVVAFKLKNAYKVGKHYSDGLCKIVEFMKKNKSNLILRLYYDYSIINTTGRHKNEITKVWIPLFKSMYESDNIQLVRYQFDEFLDKEKYHEGLFGTIVRTIPMFDFDGSKDQSLVVCNDIDSYVGFIKSVHALNKVSKWDYDILFGTMMCLKLYDRHVLTYLDKYSFNYRIMAGILYVKKSISKEVLKTFLECMINECTIYTDWYKNILKNTMKNFKIDLTVRHKWSYGIDEFFINRFVLIHMLEEKKKMALFTASTAYEKTFYMIIDILPKASPEVKSRWDSLFKKILGKWYVKDFDQCIKLVDSALYVKSKHQVSNQVSNQMIKIVKANFIKEIHAIIIKKQASKYIIPEKMEKCFLENYNHIINQIYEVKYPKGTVVVTKADGKTMG